LAVRREENETIERSSYERFAIPYTFKPQLSVLEATCAAAVAFLRIFLGSLLFAVWGAYTLLVWSAIHSLPWRIAAVAPMAALFLVSFALLMWGISALLRKLLVPRP
jgi:hypothetical protein